MKKAVFFVMSKKGFYSLREFLSEFGSLNIDFVVSSPNSNMQKDYYAEICELCSLYEVKLFDKKDNFVTEGRYVFVIGWRWMLNSPEEFFVFHDSLLPRYRGFASLPNQLLNKEKSVGVTCFYSEKEYDSGDIAGQLKYYVSYPVKIENVIDALCPLYYTLLRNLYKKLAAGEKVDRTPQNRNEITYSIWRDEEDYRINWNKDADYLIRFIDAMGFPYRGAYTTIDERKIRITAADISPDCKIENRDAGKVVFMENGIPVIICGSGLLRITEAFDDESKESIIPLKKFRTRFY